MATRVESSRNLVSLQSIAFIRPIALRIGLVGARPNTPMNVFFDGVIVNELLSSSATTNAFGAFTTTLNIPGGRFTTGTKQIVITDAASLSQLSVNGSTFGSGIATFTSTGILEHYQRITTNVTTVTVEEIRTFPVIVPIPTPVPLRDPIAQSFFTYGVTGGMFVTSIDLFFNSKDNTIPVKLDIRPMENGMPTKFGPSNPDWIVTKPAAEILTSTNASVATKFVFPTPIYLEEDKDYCFVVFSNSSNYNLYTSRIGEVSIETGRQIFQQPYVGSLFKSENNVTWSAEQFEDIKFTINQASFATNAPAILSLMVAPNYWALPGTQFSTTSGSNVIRVRMFGKHGLTATSKVNILGATDAVYRNIQNANFSGSRTVTNVIDEFTFEFQAGTNANATGTILTGGQVTQTEISSAGSGYSTAPTIAFVGGGATIAAQATAVVRDGKIVKINITNPGAGYTSEPTVTVTGVGAGASVRAIIDAMFSLQTNMTATEVAPDIPSYSYTNTSLSATVDTTRMGYEDADVTYTDGGTATFETKKRTKLPNYSVIASAANEVLKLGSTPSMLVRYSMSTSNSNVSPIIDLRNAPNIIAYSNNLRSQSGENPASTSVSTTVQAIDVVNAGSGYIAVPTINITGGGAFTNATAVAILGTTTVSSTFTVGTAGQYRLVPTVAFTGGLDVGGVAATGTVNLASAAVDTTFHTVISGGAGYTNVPTVSFINGDLAPGGVSAVATATVSGGAVTGIVISSGGSGYRQVPDIVFTPTGGDVITSTASVIVRLAPRGITGITLTSGGSGYIAAPTVVITRLGGDDLTVNGSVTAQLSGKSIQSINVVSGGAGYTSIPSVTIVRGAGDPPGVEAIGVATLNDAFNSEVSATGGSNLSRYVTKQVALETPSSGITLFSEIYSENESNVDWYIRTSMSGTSVDHQTLNWVPLQCDVQRNRSTRPDEKLDYKFYRYDLPAFDTYDLKCVLRSSNPVKAPKVYNFRSIIVA